MRVQKVIRNLCISLIVGVLFGLLPFVDFKDVPALAVCTLIGTMTGEKKGR